MKKTKFDFSVLKKKWWLWIIVAIVAIYIINGIVFAFIVYGQYPDQLAEGKSYPNNQTVTEFMVKVYPYPAAWVNYHPIWVSDYYKQLGFVEHFSEKTQQELPSHSELQKQVLDQMIDTELLKQQAQKYHIKVTNGDVNDTYQQLVDENQGEEQVNEILDSLYGMNSKDFKLLIKDQLLRQKIQEDLFVRVHAEHILIKDEGKANEILEEVKKGEKSFEDLAKEYSEDTGSRDNGGDLGWFGRGMMVQDFENAVFAMQPDTVSENLVQTEYGYHIIKVLEKQGEIDESYLDWFNNLKSSSKISIWIKIEPSDSASDDNVISPEETATESTPAESATDEGAGESQ